MGWTRSSTTAAAAITASPHRAASAVTRIRTTGEPRSPGPREACACQRSASLRSSPSRRAPAWQACKEPLMNWMESSATIYSRLLYLYPALVRRNDGEAMMQVFRDLAREELRMGMTGLVRLWARTGIDLLKSLPESYFRNISEPSGDAAQTADLIIYALLLAAFVAYGAVGFSQHHSVPRRVSTRRAGVAVIENEVLREWDAVARTTTATDTLLAGRRRRHHDSAGRNSRLRAWQEPRPRRRPRWPPAGLRQRRPCSRCRLSTFLSTSIRWVFSGCSSCRRGTLLLP